jgi:hypothetical protein
MSRINPKVDYRTLAFSNQVGERINYFSKSFSRISDNIFEKSTLPNPKKAGIMTMGSGMAKSALEGKSGLDLSPSRQFHLPACR